LGGCGDVCESCHRLNRVTVAVTLAQNLMAQTV
jgi:hypothetical protein